MIPAPGTSPKSGRLSIISIGRRLHRERQKQGLTLDQLAERSGSSRSMISAVERGERTPSVLMLDQIANALGISVSRLMTAPTENKVITLRRDQQKILEDSGRNGVGSFHRRVVSPVLTGVDFEMGRLEMAPQVDAGVFSPHLAGWSEYVVVESGELEITLDGVLHALGAGDSIYFASDCEHGFRNPGADPCVAYIVMTNQSPSD